MQIEELLSRRTDLSTFLVHLTRSDSQDFLDPTPSATAKQKLKSIIAGWNIEARTAYGHASKKVAGDAAAKASQLVVCFTETPLEHVYLLTEQIQGRQFRFEPYGIALTKPVARARGINPVWYLDITPGHSWLTQPMDRLVDAALAAGSFETSDIGKLTPFIEQMGTQPGSYRKEFWWEREWRHRGNFVLPSRIIGLCPAGEITEFQSAVHLNPVAGDAVWIDPTWGLERIIATLAGFHPDEIGTP